MVQSGCHDNDNVDASALPAARLPARALHPNAWPGARAQTEIPEIGQYGIPMRDDGARAVS